MTKISASIALVLLIIYVVPFAVYGASSAVIGFKTPEGVSPALFLLSVLISKTGTAIAFVLIFYFARSSLGGQWLLYAGIWWVMFAIGEVGQAIGPNYSWTFAVAGIASEAIYFPIAAYAVDRLITA